MYKIISIAETRLKKVEKKNKELSEDRPTIYKLIDGDKVVLEVEIPPRRLWKFK